MEVHVGGMGMKQGEQDGVKVRQSVCPYGSDRSGLPRCAYYRSSAVRFWITLSRITPTTASSDGLEELCTFFSGERFPRSGNQSLERHLHNPHTMQREHPIP